MKYVNNIKELIGNTPIIKLNNIETKENVNVFAKLELFNPGGSVKDRIGISMIEGRERAGALKKGSTIIEATAGNTGLAVTLAALNKGYRVIFVVPQKFSKEKQILMKALGAEIINTPEKEGMEGAIKKAEELKKEIRGSLSLEQFDNEDNPKAHYYGTGREIYESLEGNIDYFVIGAGSGGTLTGVLRYLKEKNSSIKGVLADPIGSTIGGGSCDSYAIEGIGNNFIPNTLDIKLIDKVIKVSDEEAFNATRFLARKEGIIAGSSSGAALAASIKLSKEIEKGNIVTLFPDRGDRYFSKDLYGGGE